MADAGGPEGRASRRGAARGAATCGVARGAAICGAARGAAICGAARGAAICGAARGAATCGAATCGAARGAAICGAARGAETCGAGAAWGAGAARGAGAAGAGRAAGAPPPPPPLCGCAAAVVAIAAETIRTAAMRVFHWNMTPPPSVAHCNSTPDMACGFRLRRGRSLNGAYMACDKFADHLFRIARPSVTSASMKVEKSTAMVAASTSVTGAIAAPTPRRW
jgi:hypothetical protein